MHPLNTVNKHFYQTIGSHFNNTRQQPWQGWQLLTDYFLQAKVVTDIGCGNGRFASFLQDTMQANVLENVHYTGLDFDKFLLKQAAKLQLNFNANWHICDVFEQSWNTKLHNTPSDVLVSFGVIHHLPKSLREIFFEQISTCLKPGGVAIITAWRFDRSHRFDRSKALDAEVKSVMNDFKILPTDLSQNDYLIDWDTGSRAIRFVHIWSDEEIEMYAKKHNLQVVKTFNADGKEGNLNRYYILQKFAVS